MDTKWIIGSIALNTASAYLLRWLDKRFSHRRKPERRAMRGKSNKRRRQSVGIRLRLPDWSWLVTASSAKHGTWDMKKAKRDKPVPEVPRNATAGRDTLPRASRLSLKDLRKGWWWHRREIRRDGVRGVDWPAAEEAARNYELMRRSARGRQFVKTYLELIPDERAVLHTLWATWEKPRYRFATRREQYEEIGWTLIYENQPRQWNLRLADKHLIDAFIGEMRILRKIQKIRPPHPLKGKKYRGVSWKLVEILDIKQNAVRTLNDSERHTLHTAQRLAQKYFNEYRRALAKQKIPPHLLFYDEDLTDDDEPLQS